MSYAAPEDYWSELAGSDDDSIEIPVSDDVLRWIENHPDVEPLQVLAQTGADPTLRDDVAEAIDVIHGDATTDDVDDKLQENESQELGEPVSKLPEVRRPVRGFNQRVLCPA